PWSAILLCFAFFGGGGAFFAYVARTNDRGLLIEHVIPLDLRGATIFYWTLCFLLLCFAATSLAMVFHRARFRQRVALTPEAILVPASRWSHEERAIPYGEILAVSKTRDH